jgi:transposase InsO family protein
MTYNAKNYVLSEGFRAALGTRAHLVTRPYRPRTNGKASSGSTARCSMNGARRASTPPTPERLSTLPAWLEDYNHRRPNSGINNNPPASRLRSTT